MASCSCPAQPGADGRQGLSHSPALAWCRGSTASLQIQCRSPKSLSLCLCPCLEPGSLQRSLVERTLGSEASSITTVDTVRQRDTLWTLMSRKPAWSRPAPPGSRTEAGVQPQTPACGRGKLLLLSRPRHFVPAAERRATLGSTLHFSSVKRGPNEVKDKMQCGAQRHVTQRGPSPAGQRAGATEARGSRTGLCPSPSDGGGRVFVLPSSGKARSSQSLGAARATCEARVSMSEGASPRRHSYRESPL